MSIETRGRIPLDYQAVTYDGSVLRFRGPRLETDDPAVLCLGGAETFGRFIHAPFGAHLSQQLDHPVLNMGVMHAGLDVLMGDPAIRAATRSAHAVVLQVLGAANMNNRFYTVHPRRNDRFLRANRDLRTIYPEVDFTGIHFTRHLLTRLAAASRDRFTLVQSELQTAWVARMVRFLQTIEAPVHLLWIGTCAPARNPTRLNRDPVLVSQSMLEQVSLHAASVSVAVPSGRDLRQSTKGMFFAAGEEAAARALPGPEVHRAAAGLLAARLRTKKADPVVPDRPERGGAAPQSLSVNSGTASKRSATKP